jgi:hypothetical protein
MVAFFSAHRSPDGHIEDDAIALPTHIMPSPRMNGCLPSSCCSETRIIPTLRASDWSIERRGEAPALKKAFSQRLLPGEVASCSIGKLQLTCR